ncbi:MAG: minor capsid protein [Magnetococcales bacterium]|nr:minor capsid protein [Magnetococcales bacterium]
MGIMPEGTWTWHKYNNWWKYSDERAKERLSTAIDLRSLTMFVNFFDVKRTIKIHAGPINLPKTKKELYNLVVAGQFNEYCDQITQDLRFLALAEHERNASCFNDMCEALGHRICMMFYGLRQYKGLMQHPEGHPYWRYHAIMDSRTRPAHAALHGKIFRYDDPIWNFIFPPNGINCRCSITSLSDYNVKKEGLTVSDSTDHLKIPFLAGDQAGLSGKPFDSLVKIL